MEINPAHNTLLSATLAELEYILYVLSHTPLVPPASHEEVNTVLKACGNAREFIKYAKKELGQQ